jgi:hypothetical protein
VITVGDLYDSSVRQEKFLASIADGIQALILATEKLGVRMQNVEAALKTAPVVHQAATPYTERPTPATTATKSEPRGALVLPPGSGRPSAFHHEPSVEVVAAKQVQDEERRAREEAETAFRQKEDAERLARLAEEHKRREAEQERIRLELLAKAEAERLKKEALENKTRLLMSDLITNVSSGLFPDESAEPAVANKKGGGLFDD